MNSRPGNSSVSINDKNERWQWQRQLLMLRLHVRFVELIHCALQTSFLLFKKIFLLILPWSFHPKTSSASPTHYFSLPSPLCLELNNLLTFRDYIFWCLKLASEAMCPALDSLPVSSLDFLLWLLVITIRMAIWLWPWPAVSTLHLSQHPHLSFNPLHSAVVLKFHPLLTAGTQFTPLAATWYVLSRLWISPF